jgi:murein DD-endopeptidase MepM/ murein hydrolase activator NlpD
MKLSLTYPTHVPHVNQGFGMCIPNSVSCELYKKLGMHGHNGIDFNAVDGEFIYAAHDGEVVYAGLDGSSGLLVVIRTFDEYDYTDNGKAFYKTLYGHLKTGSIRVAGGDKVKAGQYIAQADNTGASTGAHLHFGLKPIYPGEQSWEWWNWEQNNGYFGAIDPKPYLNSYVNSYKGSDYIAQFGAKKARVMEVAKAQQMFALANVLVSFGA